jgi:type II secretory pathway pseudopilin PulG
MIVILIIAILTGITVLVFLNVQKKASATAAQANMRLGNKALGNKALENTYFKILSGPQNYSTLAYRNSYRDMSPPTGLAPGVDGYAVNGNYMSRLEPRTIWSYMAVTGTQLYVSNVYTQNGKVVASGLTNAAASGRNWEAYLKGTVAILPYRWTGAAWRNTSSDNWYYMTVIVLDAQAGTAYYQTYNQGGIASFGSYTWNDGRGHP